MTDDQRFERWRGWLERLTADVRDLLIQRYVFREVQTLIDANPRIQRPSVFYGWMASAYSASAVAGVRRQVDTDRRAVSLLRLLGEIRHYPHVLSRDRYLAPYRARHPRLEEIEQRTFDRLAGEGADHIDPRRVQDDLTDLRNTTTNLERFATMRVAHLDENAPPRIPTYAELDHALDLLEELVKKYRLLVFAEGGEILPTVVYDWKAIFREPWIPQEGD